MMDKEAYDKHVEIYTKEHRVSSAIDLLAHLERHMNFCSTEKCLVCAENKIVLDELNRRFGRGV